MASTARLEEQERQKRDAEKAARKKPHFGYNRRFTANAGDRDGSGLYYGAGLSRART
jgi:hypothetical protein